MAKASDDFFLDGFLQVVDNCTLLSVCTTQPANKAAVAALTLASVALTAGAGGPSYSAIANGDTSGRKITVLQQASISITASGDAEHVVIDDGTNILVTTCTLQALTIGGTVTVPAWDIEIGDPT